MILRRIRERLCRWRTRRTPLPAPVTPVSPAAPPVACASPSPPEAGTPSTELLSPDTELLPEPTPEPDRYHPPLLRADQPGTGPMPIPLTPGDRARRHSSDLSRSWGVDLAVSVGTPVYAHADGLVVRTSSADADPWNGNGVWVAGGDHTVACIHLSAVAVVVGQPVVRGEILGWTGNTGASTGPHLHYEVAPVIDPLGDRWDWAGGGWG